MHCSARFTFDLVRPGGRTFGKPLSRAYLLWLSWTPKSISIFFPHNRSHMASRRKIMSRWVLLPSASHKRPRWTEWIYEWKGKTWSASTSFIIINIIQHHPTSSSIIPRGPSPQAPTRSLTVSISCKKACRNWRGGFRIWVWWLDTFGYIWCACCIFQIDNTYTTSAFQSLRQPVRVKSECILPCCSQGPHSNNRRGQSRESWANWPCALGAMYSPTFFRSEFVEIAFPSIPSILNF